MNKIFSIIVAALNDKRGIGNNEKIPWRIKADMEYFKNMTSKTTDPNKINCVIMGRKTYESIPPKFRPLPGRLNIVLTRREQNIHKNSDDDKKIKNLIYANDFEKALELAFDDDHIENVFICGGGEIYARAIADSRCKKIYYTCIYTYPTTISCNIYFPAIDDNIWILTENNDILKEGQYKFSFLVYNRKK